MITYLKFAFRSLWSVRFYTALNITGMSLGIGIFIALASTIYGVSTLDTYHENGDNIYKIFHAKDSTTKQFSDASSALLAPKITETIPEVSDYVNYIWANDFILDVNGEYSKESGFFASTAWFKVFSFPLIYGNKENVLTNPDNIVISEKLALKLFGKINVVGSKIKITIDANTFPETYIVSGVFADISEQSTLRFEFILPYSIYLQHNKGVLKWGNIGTRSYLLLRPGSDIQKIESAITHIVKENHAYFNKKGVFTLSPYKYSNQLLYQVNGELSFGFYAMIALGFMGIVILIISIINYLNLSVATTLSRRKEIGIQKFSGARFKDLSKQVFIEVAMVMFISMLLGLIIQALLLKALMPTALKVTSFLSAPVFLCGLVMGVLCTFLAVWYPLKKVLNFSPIVRSNSYAEGKVKFSVRRRILLGVQIFAALLLITTSIVVTQQVNYLFSRNLGMNKQNVVYFSKNKQINNKRSTFKRELEKLPGIEMLSFCNQLPYQIGNSTTSITWYGKDPEVKDWYSQFYVGPDFIALMKFELLDGRDFKEGDHNKVIVNQAAAEIMNLTDPVGNLISAHGQEREIIGLVKDFNFWAMDHPHHPLFIFYSVQNSSYTFVRLKDGAEVTGLNSIEKVYKSLAPKFILDYSFLDESFNKRYAHLKMIKNVSKSVGLLALIIAALGVMGVVTFFSNRRVKELGIRKINGATTGNLIWILSNQLLRILIVVSIIALPVIFLLAGMVLQNMPQSIELSVWHFVLSLLIIIGVMALMTGYTILKAVLRNPVESLRYE